MRNFFNKTTLPPIEDLITALMSANDFIHPEWSKEETIFNSIHAVRTLGAKRNSHKRIANYVNDVCKSAVEKLDEVNALEQQLQLNTDINN
jgi:hypothetical protein